MTRYVCNVMMFPFRLWIKNLPFSTCLLFSLILFVVLNMLNVASIVSARQSARELIRIVRMMSLAD